MPGNILSADVMFPQLAHRQDTDEKFAVVTDYLYMLLEQLRYTLGNLGEGNFNDAELANIGKKITEPVYLKLSGISGEIVSLRADTSGLLTRVENAEGRVTSLTQTVDGFKLEVINNDSNSFIALMSGEAVISVADVYFKGVVTFQDLSGSGRTVINGDNITTGTISAITIASCTTKISADGFGNNYGGYYMYFKDTYGEYLVGSLMLDVLGGEPRVYLRAVNRWDSSVGQYRQTPLVLYSEANVLISGETNVNVEAGSMVELFASSLVQIRSGVVHLSGNIYMNGNLVSTP